MYISYHLGIMSVGQVDTHILGVRLKRPHPTDKYEQIQILFTSDRGHCVHTRDRLSLTPRLATHVIGSR